VKNFGLKDAAGRAARAACACWCACAACAVLLGHWYLYFQIV
jgi:hypothetical protein